MAQHLYSVTLFPHSHQERREPELYNASSASAARYKAYIDFADAWNISFSEFLRMPMSIRKVPAPAKPHDGYEYVRRNYGVDPTIGGQVRIRNEGTAWNGKIAEVIYPGTSTAHIAVLVDGKECILHPNSVEVI